MPKIRSLSVSLAFLIEFSFLFQNWAFKNNRTCENRAFQKKVRDENSNKREWETESVRIFKKICICHHVKNISFTYFSGHFMIPPVYYLSYIILFQHNFRSPAKLTQLLWILKCKVGFKPTKIKFYPSFLPWLTVVKTIAWELITAVRRGCPWLKGWKEC